MLKSFIYIVMALLSAPVMAQTSNLVGGFYSSQVDSNVARVDDATSPINNPAGLAAINRSEISSGASSFSAKHKRAQNNTELSDSALHVSYVKGFDWFNLGFTLYTVGSNYESQSEFSKAKNAEGFPKVFNQTSTDKTQNNFYTVSFAPKNSFWGAGLAVLHYTATQTASQYQHEYSSSDPTKRVYKSSTTKSDFDVMAAGITLGFKKEWAGFLLGLRINSPFYLIKQNNTATFTGIASGANGSNDIIITNYQGEGDIEFKNNKIIEGSIKLGIAKVFQNGSVEFDLRITPAQMVNNVNMKGSIDAAYWDSQADTYTQQAVPVDSGSGSDYFKAVIIPSLGGDWKLSNDLTLGGGVLYQATDSKDNEGVNLVQATAGISRSYKNYLGTFSVLYNNAMDAGGNKEDSFVSGVEEKVDLSYEEVGILFSGSYHF